MTSFLFLARRILVHSIIIALFISSVSPVLTISFAETHNEPVIGEGPQEKTVEREILIKYRDESVNLRTAAGLAESADLMREQSVTKKEDIDSANISVVAVSPEETVAQKIREIEMDPRVEYAQPNYQYYPTDLGTNDTYASNLWALYQASDADIDAPEAWAL